MFDPDWLSDEVFLLPGFLLPELCAGHIKESEAQGYEDAKVTSPRGEVMRSDIRDHQRLVLDSLELAQELWLRLEETMPNIVGGDRAMGLNERLRYYRYESGQRFDWHQDGPFERGMGSRVSGH